MKKAGILLAVMVVLLAGVLFWLHGNLDYIVKNAIEKYGSQITGTKVSVSSVQIRATEGTAIVQGLVVGNPEGFKTPYALKVGKIEVELSVSSITGNVVLIKKILVDSPDVIYEKAHGTTNFDVIQKHIAGSSGSSSGGSNESNSGKKLIVEEIAIRGAKAQASAPFMSGKTLLVDLPNITIRNIGKSKGGVSPGALGRAVGAALKENLENAISFDSLAKSMGNSLNKATNAVKGLFGN